MREGGGYDSCGVLVDLRVDDHATPIAELERLYGLHQLYFGETPEEEWITVDAGLEDELRGRLAGLGYDTGDLAATWRPGPASRTSRNAWTASRESTRSSSRS